MNDELFDRQVQDATRRLADGPASPALRARVAAIPAEHPRRMRGAHRLFGSLRFTGAAVALVVLVVAAALVVATLPRNNAVAPGTTHGPSAAPSAAPSPSSTVTPSAAVGELGQTWTALTQVPALAKAGIVGVVAHNGEFVAVGPVERSPGAAVAWVSPDGVAWTRHEFAANPAGAFTVSGLSDGPDGLVAVGTRATPSGDVPAAWRSSDGVSWTEADIVSAPATCPDSAVAVAGGPVGYVVLGQRGICVGGAGAAPPDRAPLLWHSSDGVRWQAISFSDHTAILTAVAVGGPGFIVAGNRQVGGTWQTAVWTSSDASSWSPASELPGGGQIKVNAIAAGPSLILAISGRADPGETQGAIWATTDGTAWTQVEVLGEQNPTITAVGWTAIGFVAAGPADNATPGGAPVVLQLSQDGAHWQTLTSKSIPQAMPYGIAALSGRIVVVGGSANPASAFVLVSGGAATPVGSQPAWSQVMSTGAANALLRDGDTMMSAIPFSSGYVVAGNADNGQSAVIWHTSDGVTWQRLDNGPSFTSSQMTALVAIPGGILALGTASHLDSLCAGGAASNCNPVFPIRLWTSSDGRTWQELPESATAAFGRATLGPIAAGPGGLVLFGMHVPVSASSPSTPMEWTSADGRIWQAQTQFGLAFPKGFVNDLAHIANGFVAVGTDTASGPTRTVGAAWTSADGTTWTAAGAPPTSQEVVRLLTCAGGLFAVGITGGSKTFWASGDGRTWTDVSASSLPFASTDTSPVLLSDGTQIVAVGADRGGNAGTWVSRDGTSWQHLAGPSQAPTISTTAGGAIGASGPQGIVLATTSATSTGFSTTVWVLR